MAKRSSTAIHGPAGQYRNAHWLSIHQPKRKDGKPDKRYRMEAISDEEIARDKSRARKSTKKYRARKRSENQSEGLAMGFFWLALIGFMILFFLPELFAGTTFFVGWQCIKWVKNRKFNPYCKSGMIATLAVISTVPAYVGGLELHKEMEFDRGSMIQHVIETNFGDKN